MIVSQINTAITTITTRVINGIRAYIATANASSQALPFSGNTIIETSTDNIFSCYHLPVNKTARQNIYLFAGRPSFVSLITVFLYCVRSESIIPQYTNYNKCFTCSQNICYKKLLSPTNQNLLNEYLLQS